MTSLNLEVIYKGNVLTVYGVVDDQGVCLASAWLANLDNKAQSQFRARFDRLTTVGYLRSPEEMRELVCEGRPKVSEIKTRSGHRLYVVRCDSDWVATHGAKKPPDRKVCNEAERARMIWKGAQG